MTTHNKNDKNHNKITKMFNLKQKWKIQKQRIKNMNKKYCILTILKKTLVQIPHSAWKNNPPKKHLKNVVCFATLYMSKEQTVQVELQQFNIQCEGIHNTILENRK